ncbi:MAG TPA: ABC transporter permease [Micromonosporaceae bacterium]|jgi:spermidine/putrescine transport system permease protein|nr:ABC transporter permease [Micromonosporaceae bacterium]
MTSITDSRGQGLDRLESGERRAPRRRPRRRVGDALLHSYTWLVIVWLSLPVLVMIVFSFNNPHGRYNTTWVGFTTKYWSSKLFAFEDLTQALITSLVIAVLSTLITTILGTMIGIALGKYRFRGQGSFNLLLFAVISAPEIVLGASLLSLFTTFNTGLGYVTILIAHVMFSLSFVAIVVRARVLTLDPSIEDAARDLGADSWTTFRRVTFPMIVPGILSGALLAFVLSIDDYVVTSFTSGNVTTFPLWIYGVSKLGLPPQADVMGTMIFVAGLLIAGTNAIVSTRRAAR